MTQHQNRCIFKEIARDAGVPPSSGLRKKALCTPYGSQSVSFSTVMKLHLPKALRTALLAC
ncbi:MAG: hypothetical protein MR890_00300, partial [Akkermansia muciniphila]|nr:hypothetical protein [Akkermansia muciniphila]